MNTNHQLTIDNAFPNRLVENSNAFFIRLGADSANNLDFSSGNGINNGNAETYMNVGEAMRQAMVELLSVKK